MVEINDAVEMFQQYLLVEKGLSKQTVENYTEDLKQFFLLFKDRQYVEQLLGEDLMEFLRYQLANGKTVSTVCRRLSTTRSFFLFLKKEGHFKGEIPDIDFPKKPAHLPNCLSVEEVEDLLNAPDLEKPEGIRDRAMLETMYASGLRVSELLALERKNVNLKKAVITVFGKGAKERRVPLGDFAIEYIQKYKFSFILLKSTQVNANQIILIKKLKFYSWDDNFFDKFERLEKLVNGAFSFIIQSLYK